MELSGRERRRYPRIAIKISVKLKIQGREMIGELWNISVGGALVQVERSVENYLKCDLQVPKVGSIRAIVLQGTSPISLQFHNLTNESQVKIEALLAKIGPKDDDANEVLDASLDDNMLDGPL